jgi:hypothetical protein
MPIMSEPAPEARGTMLALGVTAGGLGKMAAGVIGSSLIAGPGFTVAALLSAIVGAVTLVVFPHSERSEAQPKKRPPLRSGCELTNSVKCTRFCESLDKTINIGYHFDRAWPSFWAICVSIARLSC